MTEDKVTLTEYRPHTAVIITIGFNSMTLFVEEPIDQIKTVLEKINNQEYFTPRIVQITEKYPGKGKKVSETTLDQANFIYLINTEIKEELISKIK